MASRSWVKAHSPYWSLHVEAWRQSGKARADYCRQHGLSTKTFERWMKHLISKEEESLGVCRIRDARIYPSVGLAVVTNSQSQTNLVRNLAASTL